MDDEGPPAGVELEIAPNPTLTQAEVDALPEGVLVEVTWSGGNGPHTYRTVHHYGAVHVDNVYLDRLNFVGDDSPYTVVRRIRCR